MAAIATPSTITPLLLLLTLLQSQPSIMGADPPSSDDVTSNVDIPETHVSNSVEIFCLVLVGLFFTTGILFVSASWLMEATWRAGRAAPDGGPPAIQPQAIPTCPYKDVKMRRPVGRVQLECAVCLSEFEDHEELRVLPKCSHVFHPHCLEPWLVSQITCPVCRAVLTPAKPNCGHRSGSGEPESSDGHPPPHVITVHPNSPLPPVLDRGRPSHPDPLDRDEEFTLSTGSGSAEEGG